MSINIYTYTYRAGLKVNKYAYVEKAGGLTEMKTNRNTVLSYSSSSITGVLEYLHFLFFSYH